MAETIKLVQSDDLPGITLTIRDSNKGAAGQELDRKDPSTWAPVDLTGCVVSAAVSVAGSLLAIEVLPCTVLEPAVGRIFVSVSDASFVASEGQYQIEVTVEFPEGQQTVYDMLSVSVRGRIKNAF